MWMDRIRAHHHRDRRGSEYKTNSIHLPCLLRFGGERRGDDADDEEGDEHRVTPTLHAGPPASRACVLPGKQANGSRSERGGQPTWAERLTFVSASSGRSDQARRSTLGGAVRNERRPLG